MLRHLTSPLRDGQRPSPNLQRTQSSSSALSNTESPPRPTLGRRLSTSPADLIKKMSPAAKIKVSLQLRQALRLLRLRDLDDFQLNFLRTDAFLQPWVEFRDGFLLIQPKGMPLASSPGEVTRRDILHCYTYYDEGKLRYDPRSDPNRREYDPYVSDYNVLDKTNWDVVDHEKLLYVWLLQSFKVGKKKNPYGFEYFQNLNICTAWEEVIIPMVEAVRNDYNPKGRRHYGPFAKYIEEIAPSRLAFPESNVTADQQFDMGGALENIAAKKVASKKTDSHGRRTGSKIDPVTGWLMTAKEARQEEDDKELRDVFAQYGHVVERPKLKKSLDKWLREQRLLRERNAALKALESGPDAVAISSHNPMSHYHDEPAQGSNNYFEERLRMARETERRNRTSTSPQTIHIHQRDISGYEKLARSPSHLSRRESASALYTAIRDSNPFLNLEDPALIYGHPSERPPPPSTNTVDPSAAGLIADKSVTLDAFSYLSLDSPGGMGASSVEDESSPLQRSANRPFNNENSPHERTATIPVEAKPSPLEEVVSGYQGMTLSSTPPLDLRKPSYEGTAYGVPSPASMKMKEARPTERTRPTRIPSPIEIPPNEVTRKYHPIVEKAVERAETTRTPMGSSPPVPPKNPMRYTSPHGHVRGAHSLASGASGSGQHVPRIVSRENIRAALSTNDSDESLELQPSSPGDRTAFAGIGGRGLNTGESPKIQTYNSHMFPRVGRSPTPVRYGGMERGNGNYELGVIGERDAIEE